MKMIIGGFAQGKGRFAREHFGEEIFLIDDILDRCKASEDDFNKIRSLIDIHPEAVIICTDIGNGLVPVDKHERLFREEYGRFLIELADHADEVWRVFMGIGQRIK